MRSDGDVFGEERAGGSGGAVPLRSMACARMPCVMRLSVLPSQAVALSRTSSNDGIFLIFCFSIKFCYVLGVEYHRGVTRGQRDINSLETER